MRSARPGNIRCMMTSRASSPVWAVCSQSDGAVHLRWYGFVLAGERTLCGEPVSVAEATKPFHQAGCLACAAQALGRGVLCVAERQAFISLPRFMWRHHRTARDAIPESRAPTDPRLTRATTGSAPSGD